MYNLNESNFTYNRNLIISVTSRLILNMENHTIKAVIIHIAYIARTVPLTWTPLHFLHVRAQWSRKWTIKPRVRIRTTCHAPPSLRDASGGLELERNIDLQ